jgi:hypothetical protein
MRHFKQFFEDPNFRLVVMREKTDNRQMDIFTGDSFKLHYLFLSNLGCDVCLNEL